MCVPVAAAAIALTLISAGVTAYGQVSAGNAANAQAKYEAKVADRNAKMSDAAGQDARKRGERSQLERWRRAAQQAGDQRAGFAAAGLDVNFGTPAMVVEDTAMIAGEDSLMLAENTKREVQGFDIEGANYKDSAKASRMRGKAAKQAGYIGAAGTILGGAAQAAGSFKPRGGG